MRRVLLSGVFLLCFHAEAINSKEAPLCRDHLEAAFMSGGFKGDQGALFSWSEMVRELQARHFQKYLNAEMLRKTFWPFWVFEDSSAREILLTGFALSDEAASFSEAPQFIQEFSSIEELVIEWERAFVAAGGELSTLWNSETKKRFYRRFFLEQALLHQERFGITDEVQPQTFREHDDGDPLSLLAQFGQITLYFGSTTQFQREALDFIRSHHRQRTPRTIDAGLAERRALNRRLAGAGRVTGSPHRQADLRKRTQEDWIEGAILRLSCYEEGGLTPLPLLLRETSDTSDILQTQVVFPHYDEVRAVFGSLGKFVQEVNKALGKLVITLGPGAANWEQELLIQVGIFMDVESSGTTSVFDVNMSSDLFYRARIELRDLHEAIRRRLGR